MNTYTITLKHWIDKEEDYWIAEIPELPGCMSHGYTIKETLKNIEDAKICWIDAAENISMIKVPIDKNATPIIKILGEYTEEEKQKCYKTVNDFYELYDKIFKNVVFLKDG